MSVNAAKANDAQFERDLTFLMKSEPKRDQADVLGDEKNEHQEVNEQKLSNPKLRKKKSSYDNQRNDSPNRSRNNSRLTKKKSYHGLKPESRKASLPNLPKTELADSTDGSKSQTEKTPEQEAAEKQRRTIRNLKRKERRKKAAAYRKLEQNQDKDSEGEISDASSFRKPLGEPEDSEFDDTLSYMSDDSMASGISTTKKIGKRAVSAPIRRIDSATSIDLDDTNTTIEDSSFDLDLMIADERKRSVSEFLPPTPSFTPTKDLLNRKKSVSDLIKQHEGSPSRNGLLNSKRSVSELIQQHGGGTIKTFRRDSLITPPKDLLNSRKKSVADLIASNEIESPNKNANPFEITLRPTKKQNSNGKFTSESLPQIQSIKTIIGLSHQQILNLELNDVKIKTIVSSSKVSKFAQNALNFVIKHTGDLFEDLEKKSVFFKLCVNVALYESIGFRKTIRSNPEIPEWFGGYDEINLETTRTKLTPSNKDIHQNNFDYSVLSYFGHILIWALYHQRMGKISPLFIEKYSLELPQSSIRSSIGGYHLWDRLIRESKGMNSKRWKHIIKFRQSFAYEEDQFMLMLRFMKVAETIP